MKKIKKTLFFLLLNILVSTNTSSTTNPPQHFKKKAFDNVKKDVFSKNSKKYSISDENYQCKLNVRSYKIDRNKKKFELLSTIYTKSPDTFDATGSNINIVDAKQCAKANILITKWLHDQPQTLFWSKPKDYTDLVILTTK